MVHQKIIDITIGIVIGITTMTLLGIIYIPPKQKIKLNDESDESADELEHTKK